MIGKQTMNQPQFTFTNLTVNDWIETLALVHSTKTEDVTRLLDIIARYAVTPYTAPTILDALAYIAAFTAAMSEYVATQTREASRRDGVT